MLSGRLPYGPSIACSRRRLPSLSTLGESRNASVASATASQSGSPCTAGQQFTFLCASCRPDVSTAPVPWPMAEASAPCQFRHLKFGVRPGTIHYRGYCEYPVNRELSVLSLKHPLHSVSKKSCTLSRGVPQVVGTFVVPLCMNCE